MRVRVVVRDVRQVFTWYAEIVRAIVIPDGEDDGAGVAHPRRATVRPRGDGKDRLTVVFVTLDGHHLFVKRNLQLIGIDHAAVVAQRFEPHRLVVRGDQRQAADLQQLRRGEEHHMRREVEDRIDEDSLLDDDGVEAALLRGDGGGETGRASADDQDIANGHSEIISFGSFGTGRSERLGRSECSTQRSATTRRFETSPSTVTSGAAPGRAASPKLRLAEVPAPLRVTRGTAAITPYVPAGTLVMRNLPVASLGALLRKGGPKGVRDGNRTMAPGTGCPEESTTMPET